MSIRLNLSLAAFAVLGSCALAHPASAHAHLKAAVPPVDGKVTKAPTDLELTFSEGVNPKFSGVTVVAPDGSKLRTDGVQLGPDRDTSLRVPLPSGLAPGRYTVEWHALATDGHKTSGSFGFTIAP